MPQRSLRVLVLLATTLAVLAALFVAPPATADRAAAKDKDDPRAEQAKAALAEVEEMLAGKPGKGRTPGTAARNGQSAPGGRGLTLAMRDLFVARDALAGTARERADAVLARPTTHNDSPNTPDFEPKYCTSSSCPDVKRTCNRKQCVHYVTRGPHATTKRYAASVRRAAARSHRKYVDWGYRQPFNDPGGQRNGGNRKRDIYLVDLPGSIFGYAVPEWQVGEGRGASSYLVLDENYREFCSGGCSNAQAKTFMKATIAHEYFHAVQFAYDYAEDSWLMEATATWVEDEVFDGVNDNVNYLYDFSGVLRSPEISLDSPGSSPYANWIYFRYLSEKWGRKVVRRIWQKADAWGGYGGHRNPRDQYSIEAVRNTVTGTGGVNFPRSYARFHDANRRPRRFYSEAKGQRYPHSPRAGAYRLTPSHTSKTRTFRLDHLSAKSYRVKRRNFPRGWKLRVSIDGVGGSNGFAYATVKRRDGSLDRVRFSLGGDGHKTRSVPWGRSVRWVEFTIVNASTRYQNCWSDTNLLDGAFSCRGYPRDDDVSQRLVTTAYRR